MESEYGLGRTPPYSLYESESGKWGLFDGNGKRLPAVFDKIDENRFSSVPWEIVAFNEKEGFELVSWYDPCEVWFNFTFSNPAYPKEFAVYLWKRPEKKIDEYADTLYSLIPEESHWIIDEILKVEDLDRLNDRDLYTTINAMLCNRSELRDPSSVNTLLDPVMRNAKVDTDIKVALWNAKVLLDNHIKETQEQYLELSFASAKNLTQRRKGLAEGNYEL
ncbi:MAG: hypothetical protein K2I08_04545 [Muribaculaceae bacterium]|nr:hypothetical protein [Muribaculaceae bacterium]